MNDHQVAEVSAEYLVDMVEEAVPVGYKKTEVGVIPEDWGVQTGRELFIKIQDGTHFSPKISGGEFLYVTSKNVKFGHLYLNSAEYIDRVQHESIYKRCDVRKGDILLTKDGANTGNAALNILDKPFSLLSSVAFLRLDFSKHSPEFFLQQILSNDFQGYIQEEISGNAITRLTLQKINNLKFYVPCKAEQTTIANALSDVDALISELEKLIAKKQAIKTATMQQLLTGRTRLPQFTLREDGSKKGYKQSELGEIPEDWLIKTVGQLCSYQNGKAQESLFNPHDGYRVISIGNYSEQGKYISSESFISKSLKAIVGKFALNTDDLAMILNDKTSVGTIIGRVILIDTDDSYVMNQRTMRLTSKGEIKASYLHKLINSDKIHKSIVGLAKPGTQIYVNTDDVLNLEIPFPPNLLEQTTIATILSDMDEEIQALEQRLAKTRQIKQGMMQELLTGKTRLV